ncbi:MAG: signal peptidase I [Candidatus Merdivicinus sp.]|jgi:signal peptidase I
MNENQPPHHSDAEIDAILSQLEKLDRETTCTVAVDSQKIPAKHLVKTEVAEWIRSFLIAGAAAFLIFGVLLRFVMVDGISMEPTLQNGDQLLMYTFFYQPEAGDVVILSEKTGLDKPLVKRVIATAGQTIDLSGGRVWIDGEALEEPYVAENWQDSGDLSYPLTVPEGYIYVMGDNRNHSTDSRSERIGLVEEKEVLGKVLFRIFPIRRLGLIN